MRKGCLGFILLIIIASVVVVSLVVPSIDEEGSPSERKLAKTIETTPEQAKVVAEVLKEVGIENLSLIEHDELLDGANAEGEKGYRINTNDASNIILYMSEDGKVNIVRWSDNDLYAEGKILSKLSDYVLTNKEKSDLQFRCQEAIKQILKSPSTAKFPNILEWKFGKQDGVIVVQSYVDAQNSFGAETRSEFQFKIKDGKAISLIFDGKEYIQQ